MVLFPMPENYSWVKVGGTSENQTNDKQVREGGKEDCHAIATSKLRNTTRFVPLLI